MFGYVKFSWYLSSNADLFIKKWNISVETETYEMQAYV
jgi:hypothetical protein